VQIEHDEGVRPDTTAETLGGLTPAFQQNGTITAGNASQISDGAAAVVVMSDDEYARRTTPGIARIISHAMVAGPDTALHSQPSHAISRALGRAGLELDALQRVEINEAFASVVVQSIRDLNIDPELVNVHGGAIALGHPIGTSGTRIVGTLARQLQSLGSTTVGAAGICGGGGQGAAMVLQAL
jgi:acetyl-CoA C-acetyltransferase